MHNYESANAHFPAGCILSNNLSWNVFVLPYIEQESLYENFRFEESNFYDYNQQFALNEINDFFCPSAQLRKAAHGSSKYPSSTGEQTYGSHYYGVAGPVGLDFGGETYPAMKASQCGDLATSGVLGRDTKVRVSEITDGTSNTLLLGEIANTWGAGAGHGSMYFGPANGGDGASWVRGVGFGTKDTGSAEGTRCVSSVKSVQYGVNQPYNRFGWASFSSLHPGGANFARCDGSVVFVDDDVDIYVYKATASKDQDEPETIE